MGDTDIKIVKYNPDLKKIWNDFVESSKNGTFLFNRDYMDYHDDRFHDNSYLIYSKGKLYCLLPANIKDDVLYSHQGLTYGGLVMNNKCTAEDILKVFESLMEELKSKDISKFLYKPVPHIYHKLPSEEDLYALFRMDAKLIVRNVSTVIDTQHPPGFSALRKRCVKKSKKYGVEIRETSDLKSFWKILTYNLDAKYGAKPVHTLQEMENLGARFPQIRLYGAYEKGEMTGGVLCFDTDEVKKVQYISASPRGKETGAIDAIFHYILEKEASRRYLDFGTSNEDGGRYLNETLIRQKEGFGGRAICYDTYEIRPRDF